MILRGLLLTTRNDQLGTTQALYDDKGQQEWQAVYLPFGKQPNRGPKALDYRLRFAGQTEDEETELYYNYFRDYDPSTGRYIQSDPIGLLYDFSDPMMQVAVKSGFPLSSSGGGRLGQINHLYAYVHNNPVMFYDFFGLYGTTSCAYYAKTCEKGEWYEYPYVCTAQYICPLFFEGEENGWYQCVRQCLQEEHHRRENSEGFCPITDNPYTDHTTCFTACGINSGNPGLPGAPPRP